MSHDRTSGFREGGLTKISVGFDQRCFSMLREAAEMSGVSLGEMVRVVVDAGWEKLREEGQAANAIAKPAA